MAKPRGSLIKIEKQLAFEFDSKIAQLLTVDEIFERANEMVLSRLREDRRLERKAASFRGESLAVYISMWANTSPAGGLILLGISDDGVFEGCKSLEQKTVNEIEMTGHTFCADAKCEFKRVPVQNNRGADDFVILIRVHYNPDVVVKLSNGTAYVRRSDTKHKLRSEEVQELAIDKRQISFEEQPCLLEYPADFDGSAISEWCQEVRTRMGSGDGLADPEIMENRHLGKLKNGEFIPNYACAILFAKDPRKIIPGCQIRFLRFDGEVEGTGDKYNAVKDVWVEGSIPAMVSKAESVIESQLRTFSPLNTDGKFYPLPEYPRLAWYEALVNACVHRSYGNGMKNICVFVRMFDDRLEIESPGPFPPFVTSDNIYSMHAPRNPHLMQALWFLRLVQMNREGTRRMRDTMSEMRLPAPEFWQKEIGYSLVRVILRNNIKLRRVWVDQDVGRLVGEVLAADLTELEKRVLNWVAEYGRITVSDAGKLVGARKSWKAAENVLMRLVELRILQWIRYQPREKGNRDPRAFFRLRSTEPIPEGAFEETAMPSKARRRTNNRP